jgi:hypothetical protein
MGVIVAIPVELFCFGSITHGSFFLFGTQEGFSIPRHEAESREYRGQVRLSASTFFCKLTARVRDDPATSTEIFPRAGAP